MTPISATQALQRAAADLARSHIVSGRRPRRVASLEALPRLPAWLDRVERELASRGAELDHAAGAVEWFLDNAYIVERTVRQLRLDMPWSFYTRLPALDATGEPRVYALCREFVALSDLQTSVRELVRFVRAYQAVAPLRLGELWAMPSMLRLCSLDVLATALANLAPGAGPAPTGTHAPCLNLDITDSVARAVVEMRSLARIDWTQFFLSTSVVERVLRTDPAGVYRRMDFETCDRYRKVVERIAAGTGRAEEVVARRAVERAARAAEGRGTHVGFHLVDEGRWAFERGLGYRPRATERLTRVLFRHAAAWYFAALTLASGIALLVPALLLAALGTGPWLFALGMVAAFLPATTLAVTVVQWAITLVLPPRVLPKLDFRTSIPADCRTAVAIPALLGDRDDVEHLLRQIELHYLCNPHAELRFVLLTDCVDADHKEMPNDAELVEAARTGVRELNRTHGRGGAGPFHLLHRDRRWNAAESCWMGWERKRGKLEEFNRLLGSSSSGFAGFAVHEGDARGLEGVRFVITLDADTVLPRGAAARLASILGHPLNRAEVDPATGRVRAGYTVVQPRVEIAPGLGDESAFVRLFRGDGTIDIYTRAVSDVYQDLFGCALYTGKGIYDVDAFARSLEGRAPENAILSHDLWEGLHGRVALATDVMLHEDYPPHYLAFARRMHRWLRGDWQLLPWLRRRVPGSGDARVPTRFSALDVWKIVDNLRRSLLTPSLMLLLVVGWLWLPGHPAGWTALALLTPAAHLFTDLVSGLARGRRRATRQPALYGTLQGLRRNAGRWLLYLVFLPFEAALACDAIVRTLARVLVTRRHLLEWRSAFRTAQFFRMHRRRLAVWKEMAAAPITALALIAMLVVLEPQALPVAAPLLLAWLVSPEVALLISRPHRRHARPLGNAETLHLRRLARRTWLFFETFVGPDDQWLAPDNFQESPGGELAHRTSPTNIGLMLLSTLAAWDLGFVTLTDLNSRLRSSLANLARLQRYRGHLLNWYDTRTLEPLLPRYVSTVDSGNLAAALLTLAQGCRDAQDLPMQPAEQWDGLLDELALVADAVERLFAGETNDELVDLREGIADLRRRINESRESPHMRWHLLDGLAAEEDAVTNLERLLLAVLGARRVRRDPDRLRELRTWLERFHRHVRGMRRDLGLLLPWLDLLQHRPPVIETLLSRAARAGADRQLIDAMPTTLSLSGVSATVERGHSLLARLRGWLDEDSVSGAQRADALRWIEEVRRALATGADHARTLCDELSAIADAARAEVAAVDFAFLYDAGHQLFHIGYNLSADRLDSGLYDLLASEARLASFLAIAKGDVRMSHWFHLGRPLTRVGGAICLLSWGGTMFEYLMPKLLMVTGERTLLACSERAATDRQIRHGERLGVPWGVSESGFYHFDAGRNYQYRSFGVPGLGLRRGLESDVVVTPYASVLALATRPQAAMQNILRLEELGALGLFGLYEALDFTPERVPDGTSFQTVRSYMAHHQGMILLALDNALRHNIMRRRFHDDTLVQTTAQLLFERAPSAPIVEFPRVGDAAPTGRAVARVQLEGWSPLAGGAVPEVLALGNGRLTTLVTDGGGGGLRWNDWSLTRWVPDVTTDRSGFRIHVRDEESGHAWPAARGGGGPGEREVAFHAHMAEFHRREQGIRVRTEITVAASEDIEIRRVTLTNDGSVPRRVTLVSHADITLDFTERFERHPAFRRLFVESEFLPDTNALLFRRRSAELDERPPLLLHRFVSRGAAVAAGFESSRGHFVGRQGDERTPCALRKGLGGHEGSVLDPVAALAVSVTLAPHGSEQVAFLTAVGSSRATVLEVTRRFETADALEWAFDLAYSESCREATLLGLRPGEPALANRLLSRLIHPGSPSRTDADVISANRFGQPRLWGMGLSGDRPVLLLHIRDADADRLLLPVLRFHHLWRRRRIEIDVVVVQHAVSGYGDEALSGLRDVVAREAAQDWLGRPGGIFLMRADQISPEDGRLLAIVACVVLDSQEGDLAGQLSDGAAARLLPPFAATSPPGAPIPPVSRPADLLHDNGIGGFTPDGRAYVIHLRPGETTPAPWCNVLANSGFGSLVTESGGGYTWALNSGENRLTPWTNDPVIDPPSESLYLRDEQTADVWTTTPRPAGTDAACQVRHGAGYTEFLQHSHGLEQRMQVFVAVADPVKIVRLSLRNAWNRPRRITATYYAEWVLGSRRAGNIRLIVPRYEPAHGALLARAPWNPEFAERVAFLVADRAPHGFTTDRAEFLGHRGDPAQPAALARWGLSGEVRAGQDPCAALQVHVELPAGASETLHFAFGQGDNDGHTLELVKRYHDAAAVETAWDDLARHWEKQLDAIRVKTPEPAMDLMLNRWLLYQALVSRLDARTGFYQSSGAFGFRDQLQDAMALVHVEPERLRRHLLECARHQFEEGDVLHWWHPPSGRGVRTRCSDDMLWLPWVAGFYVEATGDVSILDEPVPFLAGEPLRDSERQRYEQFGTSAETTSLFEHCRRSLERGVTRGVHGLPLMGDGDWNDGMNRVGAEGRGESVWLGWFIIATAEGFARLCDVRGQPDTATLWRGRAAGIRDAVERAGWDGAWYRRAYDDAGYALGSAESDECRIDSIAQSWAVLCGGADPARAARALRSAEERLTQEDDRVIRLLWPPFDRTLRNPGYIKAYPPGIRENGGQYTHAAVWMAWAFALRGDGERAERLFRLMNPILHASSPEDAERYRVEPYVIAADVGTVPPHVGRGGWTWYTGSASWAWRLGVEAILGLQRVGGRLRIDPCVPPAWDGFEARVRGPRGTLRVYVTNPDKVGCGVAEILVDDVPASTNEVAFPENGGVREVHVRLGVSRATVSRAAP